VFKGLNYYTWTVKQFDSGPQRTLSIRRHQ